MSCRTMTCFNISHEIQSVIIIHYQNSNPVSVELSVSCFNRLSVSLLADRHTTWTFFFKLKVLKRWGMGKGRSCSFLVRTDRGWILEIIFIIQLHQQLMNWQVWQLLGPLGHCGETLPSPLINQWTICNSIFSRKTQEGGAHQLFQNVRVCYRGLISIALSISFNVTQLLLKYLDMCVHGVIYYF